MRVSKLLMAALVVGVAVALLPSLLPTGPAGSFNAAGLLEADKLAMAALVIFVGGLATALTPCVYPLIIDVRSIRLGAAKRLGAAA
jgi:thiol:disulfide interchange protein DsbD